MIHVGADRTMDASRPPFRLAMWSPPRARSTMMMRVFEALGCAVLDEPFYAYWLATLNRTSDPGFDETIAHHETDWRRVIDLVLGPAPGERDWYYQKHMAIHMLDEVDLSWMSQVRNCFLIRDPREVVVSMSEFRTLEFDGTHDVDAAAHLVGIPQLERIFDRSCEIEGGIPPVIDADDVLKNPTGVLGKLCDRIGMPFDADAPIRWKRGRHAYDGAWSDAWYGKVYETTELGPYRAKSVVVPDSLQPIVERCMPVFEKISQHKII